jgi:transcriptional regulator with XRE-family HTH domain
MAVNWGFKIKELRKNRGMEQIELAQRSGLT